MSFVTQVFTLAAAVADDGTVVVTPSGYVQANFTGANASATGKVIINDNDVYDEGDPGAEIAYGASNVTITNRSGVSWPAGAEMRVQFGQAGNDRPGFQPSSAIVSLTDNSGGTASDTIAAIGASYSQAEVRNAVASLSAKIDEVLTAMRSEGVISS